MRVHAHVNPATGNRWKGVYTPDVVAVGEGPTSWTDYFNQQKRWAYGIWEILLDPRADARHRELRRRQRLLYGLRPVLLPERRDEPGARHPRHRPVPAARRRRRSNCDGLTCVRCCGRRAWAAGSLLWLWLRRFNLAEHERREIGMAGMLLALVRRAGLRRRRRSPPCCAARWRTWSPPRASCAARSRCAPSGCT